MRRWSRGVFAVALAAVGVLALTSVVASAQTYLPLTLHGQAVAPTPTASPVAPTATPEPRWVELVQDGGFEEGPSGPWLQSSLGGYQLLQYGAGNTAGHYAAYLCGYNGALDAIAQPLAVPANAISGGVAFSWFMASTDTRPQVADVLTLTILDAHAQPLETVYAVTNRSAGMEWRQAVTVDLAKYRGSTIGLQFECRTDGAYSTAWFLDDVTFPVLVP
jgi:hypothetical protein